MKRLIAFLAVAMAATTAFAADVGVSVTVGQPGFYGRIDIGDAPPPVLVYPQPIIVAPPPGVVPGPVYLRVPPGHARNWQRYCRHYNACGYPVYFVQDGWYNDVYVPHYYGRYGNPHGNPHGKAKGHDRWSGWERHD